MVHPTRSNQNSMKKFKELREGYLEEKLKASDPAGTYIHDFVHSDNPKFAGKSKAMEMILTGRLMDAQEAERCGLVSRIVPADNLIEDALATAQKIASMSLPVAMMAKDSVNRAYEMSLSEGVHFERRLFYSTFATVDQKEGMNAFAEKRKPTFIDE